MASTYPCGGGDGSLGGGRALLRGVHLGLLQQQRVARGGRLVAGSACVPHTRAMITGSHTQPGKAWDLWHQAGEGR